MQAAPEAHHGGRAAAGQPARGKPPPGRADRGPGRRGGARAGAGAVALTNMSAEGRQPTSRGGRAIRRCPPSASAGPKRHRRAREADAGADQAGRRPAPRPTRGTPDGNRTTPTPRSRRAQGRRTTLPAPARQTPTPTPTPTPKPKREVPYVVDAALLAGADSLIAKAGFKLDADDQTIGEVEQCLPQDRPELAGRRRDARDGQDGPGRPHSDGAVQPRPPRARPSTTDVKQ